MRYTGIRGNWGANARHSGCRVCANQCAKTRNYLWVVKGNLSQKLPVLRGTRHARFRIVTAEGENVGIELNQLLARYYRNRSVRKRMSEFLGAPGPGAPAAIYIVGNDGFSDFSSPSPPSQLTALLRKGWDVERSLWDRGVLIADLDLEYANFDSELAPYLEPQRIFSLQQPVLDATLGVLACYGIVPLVLISGRGFHLVWSIARDCDAFRRLATLGSLTSGLAAQIPEAPVSGRPERRI
jgi:hypothetical protein